MNLTDGSQDCPQINMKNRQEILVGCGKRVVYC